MIANTAGWDTDCNSGNVGCLLGIKNGLAGIDAGPDWRGPVADRLFLPTADGGRCITDAVRETYILVNMGRALAGQPPAVAPKDGARFHFHPARLGAGLSCRKTRRKCAGTVTVGNEGGQTGPAPASSGSGTGGARGDSDIHPAVRLAMGGYDLVCSPTLYPGQTVTAPSGGGRGSVRAGHGLPVRPRLRRGQCADDPPGRGYRP